MKSLKKNKSKVLEKDPYRHFSSIDGRHPFQKKVPNGFVKYPARKRHGGKVAFFNFEFAKEMGLIPQEHPHELTGALTEIILATFSIQIINEWDLENKTSIREEDKLPYEYMATRYLQMQHPNKQGKTSGDGRSIWNGMVKHQGRLWDISSCGTGATCLSPATIKYKKYFQSGDPTISYGCGYSEIDEGLATLFMSEVFHRNHMKTERVLALIEFPKGLSINIRAHENLLRPSHIFRFLKQDNYQGLKKIVDYYIDRQVAGGIWKDVPVQDYRRYDYFLTQFNQTFANLTAKMESEYIFCWLDWDGDNILMDGGIIDYGSVRQFGLFHEEYRYDDIDRYSTSIKEQKDKAKYTVQTFIQIVDYLKTKKKKNIKMFKNDRLLKKFNEIFAEEKLKNLLSKIGFSHKYVLFLLKNYLPQAEEFQRQFTYFERAKALRGMKKVPDGINWDAIFCMRDILRVFPQLILSRSKLLKNSEFIDILKSNYAKKEDLVLTAYRKRKISAFQKAYIKLVEIVAKFDKISQDKVLLELSMRSGIINKFDRVTGDSITNVVDKLKNLKPKLSAEELSDILVEFREYQNLDPDRKRVKITKTERQKKIFNGMLKIVREYREGL